MLDQLKFEYRADENEDVEEWVCCAEDCDATVRVTDNSVLLEGSTQHSCSPSLTMEVIGDLDGFQFKNVEGEKWKCLDCDCNIKLGKDNFLQYPHRKEMHKCFS